MYSFSNSDKHNWDKMYNNHILGGNNDSVIQNFNERSKTYEATSSAMQYSLPNHVCLLMKKHLPQAVNMNKDTTLLDIAAGTGLVSDELHKEGFQGFMDGIDGSSKMLSVARDKNLYRNLTTQIVTPENPLPYKDCSYDIAVCCAAFAYGHLEPEVVKDMVRVIKKGGWAIFSVRNNSTAKEYVTKFNNTMTSLSEDKIWKKIDEVVCDQYGFDFETDQSAKKGMKSNMYCYQKL